MKKQITVFLSCLKKAKADLRFLFKGQKPAYDLLQLSHRLEKGLLIQNPKPMWGWEKAERIVSLLRDNNETFSTTTAKAVLSAYLDVKSKSQYQEDRDKCAAFLKNTNFRPTSFDGIGGVVSVKKTEFSSEELSIIEKLFYSRHSCREFSDRHVLEEDVNHAIRMALRCPSACNRQPFRVYVIDPNQLAKQLSRDALQYKGDRTLIITGDVRAFTSGELLDWIVSPSIFAGYLTLSLHSLGIGSCVVRKDLVKPSAYNDMIRNITGMDESEVIILEMFVGYYKDEFPAPVSHRKTADKIVKYCQ